MPKVVGKVVMRVQFYGKLAGCLGKEVVVELPAACSIAEIRERLATAYPDAAQALGSRRVRACVGDTIVPDNHLVQPNETIEFFPPVSGG